MPSASKLLLTAAVAVTSSAAVLDLPIWISGDYGLAEIEAGTPPVKHLLRFDTGSSTSWLVDSWCKPSACPNYSGYQRSGYNVSASSTGTSTNISGSIPYLGGGIAGWVAYDEFSVPGCHLSWNQTFLDIYQSSWATLPADGFLGLAYNTIAEPQTATVVETLMSKHLLDQPRFSIYYGKNTTDTDGKPGLGYLTLGGSHEDRYAKEPLTWIPVIEQNPGGDFELWRAGMQSITGHVKDAKGKIRSVTTDVPAASAVFDTGAGDIEVPPGQIDAIYESIGMNYSAILAHDAIPLCSDFNSSWSVSFRFGPGAAQTITITGEQLKRPGFAYSDEYCWPPFDSSGHDGFLLIGKPFLDQFYTVFDFGAFEPAKYKPQIGFGRLREQWEPGH